MGTIDLHKKPFDTGTNCKLDIFEKYTQEWLPVMIMSKYSHCCIYDMFAGPGFDLSGQAGSPIRILTQILAQAQNIIDRKQVVGLWFNEADNEKFEALKTNCSIFIEENELLKALQASSLLKINITQCRFEDIFEEQILPALRRCPSLLFLDQNGVKHLNKFEQLVKIPRLDFLYFVSSSYYVRFGDTEAYQNVVRVDMSEIRISNYKDIHESLTNELRGLIPPYSDMRIYPFSIKKDTNIYGIVFGSSNILGVDKFLRTTWKINPINGSANFDIEDDSGKIQMDLFEGKLPTKIEKFQSDLKRAILNGEISTNAQAYIFTIGNGHIPPHANEIIKQMKKNKLIDYKSMTPAVNYDNVYKHKNIVTYQVLHA